MKTINDQVPIDKFAFLLTVVVVCVFSSQFVRGQDLIDFDTLGANNAEINGDGQFFEDIGVQLGIPFLADVDMFVQSSGTFTANTNLGERYLMEFGSLNFEFNVGVKIVVEGGGAIAAGEMDSFGPADVGSLTSSHINADLVVTDDSVFNPTVDEIITNTLVWEAGQFSTAYAHNVFNGPQFGRLFIIAVEEPIVLGDVNCDGVVNLLDVGPFISLLSSGLFELKADINQDGFVNLLDVGPFIELLSGGG